MWRFCPKEALATPFGFLYYAFKRRWAEFSSHWKRCCPMFARYHSERGKQYLHELNSIGNQFCWPMDFIAHRVERRKSYPGKCWMILALKPDRNWKKNTIPSARKKSRRFYEPSMKVLSAYYGRWFSKFSATRYSAIVVLEADTHADLCRKSVNCHLSLRNRKIESREKQHSR